MLWYRLLFYLTLDAFTDTVKFSGVQNVVRVMVRVEDNPLNIAKTLIVLFSLSNYSGVWCSFLERLFGQVLSDYGETYQPFLQALSSPFSMSRYLGASGRKGKTMTVTSEKNEGTQRTMFHSSSRPRISLEKKRKMASLYIFKRWAEAPFA